MKNPGCRFKQKAHSTHQQRRFEYGLPEYQACSLLRYTTSSKENEQEDTS